MTLRNIFGYTAGALVWLQILSPASWHIGRPWLTWVLIAPNAMYLAIWATRPIGWRISLFGGLLNALACAANGWLMPAMIAHISDGRHSPLGPFTHLRFLCDIYGWTDNCWSLGDMILLTGIIVLSIQWVCDVGLRRLRSVTNPAC